MSRTCDICGKAPMHSKKLSKSNYACHHTQNVQKPNLSKVKTVIDGTTVTLNVCAKCLRSGFIDKKVKVPKTEVSEKK